MHEEILRWDCHAYCMHGNAKGSERAKTFARLCQKYAVFCCITMGNIKAFDLRVPKPLPACESSVCSGCICNTGLLGEIIGTLQPFLWHLAVLCW